MELFRETGERYREAVTLHSCGDAYLAAGDPAAAWQVWQQALAIFDELNHAHAEQVRAKLRALPQAARSAANAATSRSSE